MKNRKKILIQREYENDKKVWLETSSGESTQGTALKNVKYITISL